MSNQQASAWAGHLHSHLGSDWLLTGSNPEVLPEFYLHKMVLVLLLWQNSFCFCDIV